MTVNPNSAPPAQFNTTNIIGVDISATPTTPFSAASSTQLFYPENNNPNLSPGTIVMAGGNSTYCFCQVGTVGSINTGDFVAFIQSVASTFTVNQLGSTQALAGVRVGVYQGSAISYGNAASLPASTSITTQWCWIALSGTNLVGNLVSTTTNNPPLFVTGTSGTLGSASTTTFLVAGVVNTGTTITGTTFPIAANQMMITQIVGSAVTVFGPY
jgi:hypothetical protein